MKLYLKYHSIGVYFEGQLSGNAKIECALETDLQKHSFPTQIELIEKITQQYENSDKHKNQWVETNNNEILDKEFKFFRQTYRDSNSTALLCPILECDELKCAHGGQVKLTSNIGKSFALMVC
ncbi:hypothetical protein [Helicobacter sp. T3_23-1056]